MRRVENVFVFNERLIQGLNNIFKTSLTLVSAQIGAGKTTAVRAFLSQVRTTVLWYSFQSGSTTVFWDGFCELVEHVDESAAKELREIAEDIPQEDTQLWKVVRILSRLAENERISFVIDNFYSDEKDKIISLVYYLAKQHIKNFYIIVISRESFEGNPELVLTGSFYYLQNDLFLLNREDIRRYYQKMEIELSAGEISLIYRYSEGWIPILWKIAGELIRTNDKEMVMKLIPDYVFEMEESLKQYAYSSLPEYIKRFLICICFSDDFSLHYAKRCWKAYCACSGINWAEQYEAEKILRYLCGRNLFISYRYNQKKYHIQYIYKKALIREYDLMPPEEQERFGQAWIKTESRSFGDTWSYETYYPKEVFASGLERFDEEKDSFSELLYITFSFLVRNEYDKYKEALRKCRYYIENHSGVTKQEKADYLFLQKRLGSVGTAEGLLEYIEAQNEAEGGEVRSRFDFIYGNPMLELWYFHDEGEIDRFLWKEERCLEKTDLGVRKKYRGFYFIMRGAAYLMQYQLNNVEICIYATESLIEKKQESGLYTAWLYLKARLLFLKGQTDAAMELLNNEIDALRRNGRNAWANNLEICIEWLTLFIDGEEGRILHDTRNEQENFLTAMESVRKLIIGALMIREKQFTAFIGYFWNNMGEEIDIFSRIFLLLYRTIAYKNLNQEEDSLECMKLAIKSASADQIYLPFILLFNDIAECGVLEGLRQTGETEYTEFVNGIVDRASVYNKNMGKTRLKSRIEKSELLTEREKEIAICAHDGMSNKEIALSLRISENTVKSSLKSIFRKLNVNSRKEL